MPKWATVQRGPPTVKKRLQNENILSFAGKWMELGNILSEVTQTQKDMHGM